MVDNCAVCTIPFFDSDKRFYIAHYGDTPAHQKCNDYRKEVDRLNLIEFDKAMDGKSHKLNKYKIKKDLSFD